MPRSVASQFKDILAAGIARSTAAKAPPAPKPAPAPKAPAPRKRTASQDLAMRRAMGLLADSGQLPEAESKIASIIGRKEPGFQSETALKLLRRRAALLPAELVSKALGEPYVAPAPPTLPAPAPVKVATPKPTPEPKRRGRPVTGNAMTAAQRTKASRDRLALKEIRISAGLLERIRRLRTANSKRMSLTTEELLDAALCAMEPMDG